jgi:hypothetical protein
MTVIAMSRREIDRMHVLRDMAAGRITASEAAQLMRLTRRHVFRLAKAYRERGPAALISTRRGKPSNRRYPAALWTEVLALIKANYPDFGPTLAREKLAERHGIHLGVETLRQWMLADGLWRDRKQRLKPVHQPRYRRDCVGELVQIDGSEHGWFEDRGPPCTLLVFIDDATSRLMYRHRQLDGLWSRQGRRGRPHERLCPSGHAGDRGPGLEGLGSGGSILTGGEVIAAEVEEIVDLIVSGEEALGLAG